MYFTRPVILQFALRKPFGIHSPFCYDFASKCIFSDEKPLDTSFIENQRKKFLNNKSNIEVIDFGKGIRFVKTRNNNEPLRYERKVGDIARGSLQSKRMCAMLYRTIRYFAPKTILELGTSLGITTAYLAKAAPQAKLITLEGCPQTASLAENFFRESGLGNIELIRGDFRKTLPGVINKLKAIDLAYIDGGHTYEGLMNNFNAIREHISESSVLIIDDIRWSAEMKKAWLEIAAHSQATLCVDMFRLGIVFFKKGLSKQIIPVAF